jgi:hypothetical protein
MRLSDAGRHRRPTKLIYLDHRLAPFLTEDATRDRSNRWLGAHFIEGKAFVWYRWRIAWHFLDSLEENARIG